MAEGGLVRLFQEYPVLARSLGTIAALWVEANLEFLGRLAADRPEIERIFGDDGEVLGNVVERSRRCRMRIAVAAASLR